MLFPLAIALAIAAPGPLDRDTAMDLCARRALAVLHPGMTLPEEGSNEVYVTGLKFEWLQASTAGDDWVIVGSIIEPKRGVQFGHRFTCRTQGSRKPSVMFGRVIRIRD